jgi:glycosyltransferase involved in cell wall biosynthesis
MRVCIVDPSLFTLAYDQHLCGGLCAAGVEVTLCGRGLRADETLRPHDHAFEARCYPLTERGQRGGSRGARAWLKATEHLWNSARLATWLRSRFDVVHFQWSPMPLVDRWHWERLARDRTVIFTVHDTTPFLGRPTSRWQQLGWRRLLDAPHGLIVHTEDGRKELLRLGVAAERISVVPHGPLQPLRTVAAEPPPLPAPQGVRTLLVFGEIKPYKGIDVLLRAAAQLPVAVAAGWRIVIAGRERCDLAELRTLAGQSRIPVEWRIGFVPDAEITPLFRGADLAVFPYRQVDASGALMLALPFGVPVVATRVGVFRELIEDGVTGWLAYPGDHADLARALERAMSDGARRATIRQNILARVTSLWSWPAIARAHVEVYRRQGRPAFHPPADAAPISSVDHDYDHSSPAVSARP